MEVAFKDVQHLTCVGRMGEGQLSQRRKPECICWDCENIALLRAEAYVWKAEERSLGQGAVALKQSPMLHISLIPKDHILGMKLV